MEGSRNHAPATHEASGAAAPEEAALHDRGLFAEWYMRLRLHQEMDRSQRAGHHLAVALLAPNPHHGEQVPERALVAAAVAVNGGVRQADLVGWLGRDKILVVIPDGDETGTKHAARRWKNPIWLKTMQLGAIRWEAFVLSEAWHYGSVDEVLDLAVSGLRQVLRPPC